MIIIGLKNYSIKLELEEFFSFFVSIPLSAIWEDLLKVTYSVQPPSEKI